MKEIDIAGRILGFTPGDKLLIFTDGLTEAENDHGVPFEEKALADVMRNNSVMNIKDYVSSIYSELIAFRGSENFDDDVCILGIGLI